MCQKHSKCGCIEWFDPPFFEPAKVIIFNLLKSMNKLKLSIKDLEDEVLNLSF